MLVLGNGDATVTVMSVYSVGCGAVSYDSLCQGRDDSSYHFVMGRYMPDNLRILQIVTKLISSIHLSWG